MIFPNVFQKAIRVPTQPVENLKNFPDGQDS
jgi:hypothetical protein